MNRHILLKNESDMSLRNKELGDLSLGGTMRQNSNTVAYGTNLMGDKRLTTVAYGTKLMDDKRLTTVA